MDNKTFIILQIQSEDEGFDIIDNGIFKDEKSYNKAVDFIKKAYADKYKVKIETVDDLDQFNVLINRVDVDLNKISGLPTDIEDIEVPDFE